MLVHGFPHVLLQTRENNYCISLFGSHYCLPDRNGRVTTEPIKPLAWNFWTWSALASKVVNLMWTWELLAQVLRPGWFRGKESACQYRRCRSHPWHRKIPWRRKWQPTQYSYLENSMDREAWWATVQRVRYDWALLSLLIEIKSDNLLNNKIVYCVCNVWFLLLVSAAFCTHIPLWTLGMLFKISMILMFYQVYLEYSLRIFIL